MTTPALQYDKLEFPLWNGNLSQAKWTVINATASAGLATLKPESIDCVVTSPPYYSLRDYGMDGQIGAEVLVNDYVSALVDVMDGVKRVLRKSGLVFLNLGDTYYSGKGMSHGVDKKSTKRRFGLRPVDRSGGLGINLRPKSVIGVPWRVALGMVERGWILRSTIIWHRPKSLPEFVRDRPKRSYEYVLMFAKDRKYFFNGKSLTDVNLEEDVWSIAARPKPTPGIETAPFPDELVERCLTLGCPANGTILDPFAGSGTTLRVSLNAGHSCIGIDLNQDFCKYMVANLSKLNVSIR